MNLPRALLIAGCVAFAGCTPRESANRYLERKAGLVVCPDANIAELAEPKDTPDVSHFAFHLEGRCKSQFLKSAFAASSGECAAMLPKQGSCIYFRKGSVIVRGLVSGNDFKVTTY